MFEHQSKCQIRKQRKKGMGIQKQQKKLLEKHFLIAFYCFGQQMSEADKARSRKQTITPTATNIALMQHLQRDKDCGKQICLLVKYNSRREMKKMLIFITIITILISNHKAIGFGSQYATQ